MKMEDKHRSEHRIIKSERSVPNLLHSDILGHRKRREGCHTQREYKILP